MRESAPFLALLCLLTLAVFAPVLGHGFLHYDDGIYVTGNPVVQGGLGWEGAGWAFTTFHHSNWSPLTWLSHMLDVALFGMAPAGHHLSSLLLHLTNTLLLFALLRRMTGALRRSALVAALFAIHPLHVEPVAWVASRKDVLSTLFALLALFFHAGWAQRGRRRDYGLSLLFTALGLLAKQMLVTLPFLLLLLDVWPLRRLAAERGEPLRLSVRALLREKLPFFALSLGFCAVAFAAQRRGGSVAGLEMLSLPRRLDNALFSTLAYLWKTVWPAGLSAFYPFPAAVQPLWRSAAALAALGVASYLAVWRLRRLGYPGVGWLWFLGTLVPVIGLVQIGDQALADRYSYLPLVGLFILASWGMADLLTRWGAPDRAFSALCLLPPLALALPAAAQLRHWRDDRALWEHALAATASNFVAHNNLGAWLHGQGDHAAAVRHLEAALRIRPGSPKAHTNLANAYLGLGRSDEALRHLSLAHAAAPDAYQVHMSLAGALARVDRSDEAAAHYARALELEPSLAPRVKAKLRALQAGGGAAAGRNVLLITVDTLRADHLSSYGFGLETSPRIDALAAQSALFERAVAASSSTAPAHASIFTSRYPAEHSIGHLNGETRLEGLPTLAEVLAGAGHATGAFVGNALLQRRTGLDRGFDHYDDALPDPERGRALVYERRAAATTARALAWLDTVPDPVFLWVHYQDPHGPYDPPADFAGRFAPSPEAGEAPLPLLETNLEFGGVPSYQVLPGLTRPSEYRARYADEIHYADHWIGELLASPRLHDALVVLTADHGESLGELGHYFMHGTTSLPAEAHVPLLLRAPGVEPRRVRSVASHVDLMPTILELVGIPAPGALSGIALGPSLRGEARLPERAVYCDMGLEASAYAEGLAVQVRPALVDPGAKRLARAYEWAGGQAVPADDRRQAGHEELRASLEAYLARREPMVEAEALAPAQVERLRALGYLDGARSE